MSKKSQPKKNKNLTGLVALEILCIAAVVALLVYILQKHLPGLIDVLKSGNETRIEEYLKSTNADMSFLVLFVMQIIQVVSIIIPGTPIQIAAGVALGLRNGFLVSYIGFILANLLVFRVARVLDSTVKKYLPQKGDNEGKLAKAYNRIVSAKNPVQIIVVANILPFLPNGIIPYAASQMKISGWQFSLAVAAGCLVPILADCTVGNLILRGNYLAAILVFVILYGFAGVMFFFDKKITAALSRRNA